MSKITDPIAATRLARAIMSDIALYNQEALRKAIKNDSLFDDLHDQLEEGRKLYEERTDPSLPRRWEPYNRAIVDVLVKRCANVDSEIW